VLLGLAQDVAGFPDTPERLSYGAPIFYRSPHTGGRILRLSMGLQACVRLRTRGFLSESYSRLIANVTMVEVAAALAPARDVPRSSLRVHIQLRSP
jgi:hypothetical protein